LHRNPACRIILQSEVIPRATGFLMVRFKVASWRVAVFCSRGGSGIDVLGEDSSGYLEVSQADAQRVTGLVPTFDIRDLCAR
jgi:hypothetical protein